MLTHHKLKGYEKSLTLAAGAEEFSSSWGWTIGDFLISPPPQP
jgi:hypothetical protein